MAQQDGHAQPSQVPSVARSGHIAHIGLIKHRTAILSLPEFLDLILCGRTILVVNIHSGGEFKGISTLGKLVGWF